MWDSAAGVIAENASTFNIVLAEFPGFGDAPIYENWMIADAVVDLHAKLNAEGILEPIIGGLSMGGYAAFAYYRLYPNEVKGLIVSNTKAAADSDEAKKGREEFAKDVEVRGFESVYERMLLKLVSESSVKKDPELIPKLKHWIESSTPIAIASGLRALALRIDSTDLLPVIFCPTLVLTGENDAIISESEMQEMSAKIQNVKFVSFMKSGHLTSIEEPEKWGAIVSSFLNAIA